MSKQIFTALLFCIALVQSTKAQLTTAVRDSVLNQLAVRLEEQYVFADKGAAAAATIRQYQKAKRYNAITEEAALAAMLTTDLQAALRDKHLRVGYSPDVLPYVEAVQMEIPEKEKARYADYLRHDNYGIGSLQVLQGNIGYIDFKYFCTPEFAGDSYAAMMNYIAGTDALIIDLRRCGGSTSPDAIPFIASYLFEKPTHLNDLYWRRGNTTQQQWTYAQVPGKRYVNKPVYVLTASATFSGAEEFAYDLKNLKRATIIGGITGGGANGGGDITLTSHFTVFMPSGRAINPITKTNWEGTGVVPDSIMNPNKALHAATLLALDTVLKSTTDEGYKQYLTDVMAAAKKNAPVYLPVTFELDGYAGAQNIFVAGSFNGWSAASLKMEQKAGRWTATTEAEPGKLSYKFIVDGQWITDPGNKATEKDGDNTNSVKMVQQLF
jgi:retinol-binding protein 3